MPDDKSNLISCRRSGHYVREIARNGSEAEVRRELRRLQDEHEHLKEWVRQMGIIPPMFKPSNAWLQDVSDNPVTPFQRDIVGD